MGWGRSHVEIFLTSHSGDLPQHRKMTHPGEVGRRGWGRGREGSEALLEIFFTSRFVERFGNRPQCHMRKVVAEVRIGLCLKKGGGDAGKIGKVGEGIFSRSCEP